MGQSKQMRGAPMALQGAGDGRLIVRAAIVPKLSQLLRVALASEEGAEDCQARHTSHVADDVVQLDVHLRERFLEVLDVSRSIREQSGPLPYIAPSHDALVLRPQTG